MLLRSRSLTICIFPLPLLFRLVLNLWFTRMFVCFPEVQPPTSILSPKTSFLIVSCVRILVLVCQLPPTVVSLIKVFFNVLNFFWCSKILPVMFPLLYNILFYPLTQAWWSWALPSKARFLDVDCLPFN